MSYTCNKKVHLIGEQIRRDNVLKENERKSFPNTPLKWTTYTQEGRCEDGHITTYQSRKPFYRLKSSCGKQRKERSKNVD